MGVFTEILNTAVSFDIDGSDGIIALDRPIIRELRGLRDRMDPELPPAFMAKDMEVAIQPHEGDVDSGDFSLTFNLKNGQTFTTDLLLFDADAEAIEAAIDVAATAAGITGWQDGDIEVTGGPLTDDEVILLFSGESVRHQNHEVTIDSDLEDSSEDPVEHGDIITLVDGQNDRTVWAVMVYAGILMGPPPTQGEAGPIVAQNTRHTFNGMPSQAFIRTMAKEAAVVDDNPAIETEILRVMGLR
jgi:hypothetical protein